MGKLQELQRQSAAADAERTRRARFSTLSVPEQLAELVLQDDIAGMPLGQVVGLVRIAVAEKHINATETEIRDEAERRHKLMLADVTGFDDAPVDLKPEDQAEGWPFPAGSRVVVQIQGHQVRGTFLSFEPTEDVGTCGVDITESNVNWGIPCGMTWVSLDQVSAEPVTPKPGHRACAHGVLGLHGICTTCGDYVGQAEAESDSLESATSDVTVSESPATEAETRVVAREVDVNPDGIVAEVRPAEMTPDRGDVTTHHTITDDEPRWSGAGAAVGVVELIPGPSKFGQAPYIDAPELKAIAERLIYEKDALADLTDLQIVYRWKAKGGNQKGWPRLGGIERVSGQTLAFIAGKAPDLLVWLAADTLRESAVSELQLEAILFDQLVSVEWSDGDEDGDPTWRLVGPEIMCHLATLEEYGAFTRKLESAKSAFVQPSLFDASVTSERFTDDEAKRVISIAAAAHAQQQEAGAGVLIHPDGTALTDDEIEAMERHELADDDMEEDDDREVRAAAQAYIDDDPGMQGDLREPSENVDLSDLPI